MRGRRTLKALARSALPPRVSIVLSLIAVALALGMHGAAAVIEPFHSALGAKVDQYARVFEVMWLWVLVGGALGQFAGRIVKAWDDWRAWMRASGGAINHRREEKAYE